MTELSFLIELLLHHDLPAKTKDLIADRIKEVEGKLTMPILTAAEPMPGYNVAPRPFIKPPIVPQIPPEQIAQNEITKAAMQHHAAVISKAASGTLDEVSTGKGTRGPRKW